MANINWDDRDFKQKTKDLIPKMADQTKKGLYEISQEIGRLSSFEVPHNIGTLAGSYGIDPEGDGYIVGYNMVYAARLHEHPEYHFQKGRKGKYLEDPIKKNLSSFKSYIEKAINQIL